MEMVWPICLRGVIKGSTKLTKKDAFLYKIMIKES